MNSEHLLIDKWRSLSTVQQQEVLNFIDFTLQKSLREKQSQSNQSRQREQKVKEWINWAAANLQNSPGLPDEALRRDNIYNEDY
jgi:hypothetical protein